MTFPAFFKKNFRLYFTNDEQFDYWREPLNRIFYKYYMYPRKNSCEIDQYSATSGDEMSNVEVENSSDSTEYRDVGSENHVESSYDPESKYDLVFTNYKNHSSIKNSVVSPPGTINEERLRLENESYECELIHRFNMLKQRRVNLKNQLGLELSLADGDDNDQSQLAPTDPTLKSKLFSNMDNEDLIDNNMNDSGISKEITPDSTPIEKYSHVFEFSDNRPLDDKNNVPHAVSVSGSSESGVVCRENSDGGNISIRVSKLLNQCPNSPNSDRLSNCSTCDIIPKVDNQNTPTFSVPLYPIPFTKIIDKSSNIGGSSLSLANFIQKSNQISPQKIVIPPRSPLSPYRRQEYNEAKCTAKKLFLSSTRLLKPNDLWPKYASCENLRPSSSFQKSFPNRSKCRIDSVDGQTQNIVSSTPSKLFDRENSNFSRSEYAATPLYCGNSMNFNRDVSTYHASLTYGPMPYKATVKIGHSARPMKVAFGAVRDVAKKSASEFTPLDSQCFKMTAKKPTVNGVSPVSYIYTPVNITCKLCRT
uniref:Uncharacterized protein n=1 Tax=Romanomermis culicivorax TaxID=13658 RepID=A0A915KDZ9_ROMCU